MNSTSDPELLGSIEKIREIEVMLKQMELNPQEKLDEFSIAQFEELETKFVRQLVAGLFESYIYPSDIEPFVQKVFLFLKKFEPKDDKSVPTGRKLTHEMKAHLKEVEALMEARSGQMSMDFYHRAYLHKYESA